MTFTAMNAKYMMNHDASAACAEASFSCRQTGRSAANIAVIMDAICMASIIICALICTISLLVLVLLGALLICRTTESLKMQRRI